MPLQEGVWFAGLVQNAMRAWACLFLAEQLLLLAQTLNVFYVSLEKIFQALLVLASASLVGCVQASMKVSIQNALMKKMSCVNVM